MKKFNVACAQGEVNLFKVDKIPENLTKVEPENGFLIVGHSESGHHHGFVDDGSVQVLERTRDVPAGMKMLYAIVDKATMLEQNAASPHDKIYVEPGMYEVRISREYNPFLQKSIAVAD